MWSRSTGYHHRSLEHFLYVLWRIPINFLISHTHTIQKIRTGLEDRCKGILTNIGRKVCENKHLGSECPEAFSLLNKGSKGRGLEEWDGWAPVG